MPSKNHALHFMLFVIPFYACCIYVLICFQSCGKAEVSYTHVLEICLSEVEQMIMLCE